MITSLCKNQGCRPNVESLPRALLICSALRVNLLRRGVDQVGGQRLAAAVALHRFQLGMCVVCASAQIEKVVNAE